MRLKSFEKSVRFYFIGIGGVSMSALAEFLLSCGYEVNGSDSARSEQTEKLSLKGVEIFIRNGGEESVRRHGKLAQADAVVYTSAISEYDEELAFAVKSGKIVLKRAEFLKEVCRSFHNVTAIAGSHGKTTCTAMCAHVLDAAKVRFAAHIGGIDSHFGNFVMTGEDFFVTEACEYKKNICEIEADRAVLLNIDRDHMECYDGYADLINTFAEYCRSAQTAFVCADDEKCLSLGDFSTFGIENVAADYRATEIRQQNERYSFTVSEYGKDIARIHLNAAGRCNIYNALAAFAAMRSYGFSETEIKCGLENFKAVKRRFEKLGTYRGATVIADYAHHPREIAATVETAKKTGGTLYVIFQPHTYSRTKLLMKEFVEVLGKIENLMIYKTYPAREFFDEAGSGATLAKNLGNCLYAESLRELKIWLKSTVQQGDTVLFLGAGDIYYIARYLLNDSGK